jgi:uncharacterized protein YcaQ
VFVGFFGGTEKTDKHYISMAIEISLEQARYRRVAGSGLIAPFNDAEAAAGVLAGVQAQIVPAAGIALWNRVAGWTAADLDHWLYRDRRLVKLWGQRGTLHLYPSADWPLLYAAQSEQPTYWERKYLRNGGDPAAHQHLVDRVVGLLAGHETLGRSDLRRFGDLGLDAAHLSGWGGLFAVLVRRGLACHAEPNAGEARMAHRERWLPSLAWNPPDSETANIELARRYLRTYGPATVQDLAYWRGSTVAEARRWLAALEPELREVVVAGMPMWTIVDQLDRLNQPAPERDGWPVRLLGRFDPLLLGLRDKTWLLDARDYAQVWRPAGHIEATLLVGGRIAGVWRYDRQGKRLRIQVRPFKRLPAFVRRQVRRIAPELATHFGLDLVDLSWEAHA